MPFCGQSRHLVYMHSTGHDEKHCPDFGKFGWKTTPNELFCDVLECEATSMLERESPEILQNKGYHLENLYLGG